LAAAERTDALLVTLENVYGYGSSGGKPMTEDHPLTATSVKGRTRAAMTRELLAAAEAGFASPSAARRLRGGRHRDALGSRVFANAVAGKRADFIGKLDLLHTYSYVPNVANGLATLGSDERAIGGAGHLPGPETVTSRAIIELAAGEIGRTVGVRIRSTLAVRALGLFSPMMRGLAEMAYEFEEPFVLDTTKYRSTFGTATTPLSTAIAETVGWYQSDGAAR
jgi:hypothetical protein